MAADLAAGGRVLQLRDALPGDEEQPQAAERARAQDLARVPRGQPEVPGPAGARAEDGPQPQQRDQTGVRDQLQAHQAAGRVSGGSAGERQDHKRGEFGLHL